jgi:hypothetical protein
MYYEPNLGEDTAHNHVNTTRGFRGMPHTVCGNFGKNEMYLTGMFYRRASTNRTKGEIC